MLHWLQGPFLAWPKAGKWWCLADNGFSQHISRPCSFCISALKWVSEVRVARREGGAAGVNMRVNRKMRGDCFGEVSLMYSCPRSATVAATQDAVVWVLERDVFRCATLTSKLDLDAGVMISGGIDENLIAEARCHA